MTININNKEEYNCLECLSNEYKLSNTYGCLRCYASQSDYCLKCHYYKENSYDNICDECQVGYYFGNDKKCKKCNYPIKINNGYCKVCSDNLKDYQLGICWCDLYHTKKDHSTCVKCPENCPYCEYNIKTNKLECLICDSGYALNSIKNCTYCGDGCEYCSLFDDSTPICSLCYSGQISNNGQCLICPENCKSCENNDICKECNTNYTLLNDGKCGKCPSNCNKCIQENNKVICLQCYDYYALKSETECVYCRNLTEEGMKGCERCKYNNLTKKFECYECAKKEKENSYEIYEAYAYITNTFQCFDNMNRKKPSLYGCAEAYKIGEKYECIKCTNYNYPGINQNLFIKINNQNICINKTDYDLSNCLEAENAGNDNEPNYSCSKCISDSFCLLKKNGRNICSYRSGKLSYCFEGEVDNKYNYKCNKCVHNSNFNSSYICNCNFGYFGKNDMCYKCDDEKNGNPGCNPEMGCSYNQQNDQLNCNKCKYGYFDYTQGQCFSCALDFDNCENCHYDTSINSLICDKCSDGYIYNSTEKKCQLKNNELTFCEDYDEINEGCIICEEKKEEYISNKKCHKCKPGYFKTKDEQCVNCRNENNGGPDCLKCVYALDVNGKQTDNIICDYCPTQFYTLSSDGKCFSCEKRVSPNCEECGFIKKDDNTEILVCKLCKPGFYLNSEGDCINYLNYLKPIQNCFRYYYRINSIPFCSYKNGTTCYCIYKQEKNPPIFNLYDDYEYINFNSFYDFKKELGILDFNIDFNIKLVDSLIEAECIQCSYGDYYLNSAGNCEKISLDDCSLFSITKNFPNRFLLCFKLCHFLNYTYQEIPYINKTSNNIETLITQDIFHYYYINLYYDYYYGINYEPYNDLFEIIDDQLKPIYVKNKLCVALPENFINPQNCQRVQYDEETKSYKCVKCYQNYVVDIDTNSCKKIIEKDYYLDKYNCLIENIGTMSNPMYSCNKCYNETWILIKNDDNIKYCKYKNEPEIKHCTEAEADTKYVNTKYNCIKCSLNFLPYKSNFFERIICQNILKKF